MKNSLMISFVMFAALALNAACFAQGEEAAPQEAPLSIETIVENGEEAAQFDCNPCAPCNPCGPRFGRLFRRPCNPCVVNPCNPCPPVNCDPCAARPMRPFRPMLNNCASCNDCAQPCGQSVSHAQVPCGQMGHCASPCASSCAFAAYDACGYPNHAPIRNFLRRVFSPRPYCGYDAFYGPCNDCNAGCAW